MCLFVQLVFIEERDVEWGRGGSKKFRNNSNRN